MILVYCFAVLATLFAGWRAWRRLRYFLHIFQLEGYKPNEYRTWLKQRRGQVLFRRSHQVALLVLAASWVGFYALEAPFWTAAFILPAWTVTFISSRLYRSVRQKKPLAYTARMQRLLATAVAFTVLPLLTGAYLGLQQGGLSGFWPYLAGFFVADLGAPLWVMLAAACMKPVETAIQNGFKRQARRTLNARPELQVIGITGSYGKTSVKFIIAEILRQRYNVLATPASYNTPMGICLVVNTRLRPEHQVLVLEMGARYRGDIQELCELAPPHLSVVTSVGVAHLETMGPIDNIALEKSDIVTYQRPGGITVLNADDPRVNAMAERTTGPVWRVSANGHPDAQIQGRDVRYGRDGASFSVEDDTGTVCTFQTRLLGAHNILNILLGVAVGRAMGLRLRQMKQAVARLEPVAHRLALRQEGAITVIDDAFNANPVGAQNAVEILGHFKDGRRVIVTPGMIELGERQWAENHAFGEHIARHADLAVLVGEAQTRPIQEGLRAAAYPDEQVKVVPSLFAAQEYLQGILQPGDVVLYENDLPDQYNEP